MKLALAGVGAVVLQATVWAQGGLLYDEIARHWMERNAATDPHSDWRALLRQRFARLELGAFDVYLPPAALAEARPTRDAAAALQALLDAQARWVQWIEGVASDPRKERGAREALVSKWLKGWSPKTFAAGKKDLAGKDLAEGLETDLGEALTGLRDEVRARLARHTGREVASVPMVIFPGRGEFVEFTCVTGLLDPLQKPFAWGAGVSTWMEYNAEGTRFVTLQYGGGNDYSQGSSVGERNPAALGELVAQVGCRAMLDRVFGSGLDPALVSSLANALVIDLYDELDTRIDGDVRSRSSQGSSVFVPGGNPDGGVLPPTSAENRWRGTKGKDHFVEVLAGVQKQSGKKGTSRAEKLARFELRSDNGSVKELVSAPFLGPGSKPPSATVLPDYLELLRCYGVAFVHWLRCAGAGAQEESESRFGELLRGLARGVNTDGLPKLFEDVYHEPLSATAAAGLFDASTLEGRFLVWLSKHG